MSRDYSYVGKYLAGERCRQGQGSAGLRQRHQAPRACCTPSCCSARSPHGIVTAIDTSAAQVSARRGEGCSRAFNAPDTLYSRYRLMPGQESCPEDEDAVLEARALLSATASPPWSPPHRPSPTRPCVSSGSATTSCPRCLSPDESLERSDVPLHSAGQSAAPVPVRSRRAASPQSGGACHHDLHKDAAHPSGRHGAARVSGRLRRLGEPHHLDREPVAGSVRRQDGGRRPSGAQFLQPGESNGGPRAALSFRIAPKRSRSRAR